MRVLLISPDVDQRVAVGEALAGAGDYRYYWISQPDLALPRGQGLRPHVILVDDALAGADPNALVRQLAAGVPEASLLLLVSPGPGALAAARDAVLIGARGFLPKPVDGGVLLATLRQVLSRHSLLPQVEYGVPTGRVITFCGPKGGTGRTTLAINTAVSLREVTKAGVALVDADFAAPAIDVALNLRGQRSIRDLLPKLNRLDVDLISSVLARHSSGVRVLLAPPPEDLENPPTLPQVQQVTAWLKRVFPWVLVDLGLPLDEAAYAFLDASDRVVMSVLPEMVGMRNARLMLAQFGQRGYPPNKVWPLLNRDGLPGGIHRAEVAQYLGQPLRFHVPNDQALATETINRGVPMVISHRRRPLAQAYRSFARELEADRQETAARRDANLALATDGLDEPKTEELPIGGGELEPARPEPASPPKGPTVLGSLRDVSPVPFQGDAADAGVRSAQSGRGPRLESGHGGKATRAGAERPARSAQLRRSRPSFITRLRAFARGERLRSVFATTGIVIIVLAIVLSLVVPWLVLSVFRDAGQPSGFLPTSSTYLALAFPRATWILS